MSDQNIYEKRLTKRLEGYWNRLRGEDKIPLYSRFNQGAISDIWENCVSFSIIKNKTKKIFHCEFIGRNVEKALGKELKDKYIILGSGESRPDPQFIKMLEKVADEGGFVLSQGQFVNKKTIVKYRDCIMPFKDSSGKISNIIVGISWRAFS